MLLGEGDAITSIKDGTTVETVDRRGAATTPSMVKREEEEDKKGKIKGFPLFK